MISHFFIDRPVFAAVISIILTLAGLSAMGVLPIAQYPNITPVQVQVSATYPGASADVVSQSVAAPIEQQVNSVNNLMYMYSSSSSTGNMNLNVFFNIGTDPDIAQVNVQNQVSLALPQLPSEVSKQGVQVQTKSSTFLMVIAIYSPDGSQDETFVGNYAYLYVLNALQRIPGANQAGIFGVPNYAMRIWLKPDRMSELGLTTDEVINAIQTQNQQFAIGQIGQSPTNGPVELTFPVSTQGRLTTPEEFENIILRASSTGAGVLRLKDVGYVTLGMQSYNLRSRFNGKIGTAIAVYQQAGANALDVSKQVRETLEELKKSFPAGLDYSIALDTTKFVKASIDEVVKTLMEAIVLVILVVFIFLQSWRATVIPIVAVIVSVIATFSGMYLLGFSINMLTLFGMVLCIGIVVDDAIVVVEAVMHNIERGLAPKEATRKAMQEVSGAVIGVALVLSAVFIPVAFMPGLVGSMYRQFALTIAIAVLISAFNALTLSPALAALVLEPKRPHAGRSLLARGFGLFNRGFDRVTVGYTHWAQLLARRAALSLVIIAGVGLLGGTIGSRLRQGFVPEEDQGVFMINVQLPNASSLQRTDAVMRQIEEILAHTEGVQAYNAIIGLGMLTNSYNSNYGSFFVRLEPWEERTAARLRLKAIMATVGAKLARLPDAIAFPFAPPTIAGFGAAGGFNVLLQDRSGSLTTLELGLQTRDFLLAARKRPELANLFTSFDPSVPQLALVLDREKARKLGVPINDVFATLQAILGGAYVNDFNRFGRLYRVFVMAEPEYRQEPEDIGSFYVRSRSTGDMVPLATLVTVSPTSGTEITTRFNLLRSVEISGVPAPGYSSGEAMAALEEVAASTLGGGMDIAYSGMSYQEKHAPSSTPIFVVAVLCVFLLLAALYESWTLPFAVLLGTPSVILGALFGVWARGFDNNVYVQIGLITLVGLAAKNSILIVEFAKQRHEQGRPLLDAATEAARLRFRPILMTAFAFIMGAVPLMLASGSGAASRQVMGTAVVVGMSIATFLGVFLTPAFFKLIEGLASKRKPAGPGSAPVPVEGGH